MISLLTNVFERSKNNSKIRAQVSQFQNEVSYSVPYLWYYKGIGTSFIILQDKKYLLLSVVMTATRTLLRNKAPSCRAGHGEKFPLSLARNTWMEGKASYFHGTKNTDQFTKKHCCITLILIKMMRNLFPKRRELKYRLLHWFPNRYTVFLYLITCEILGHVN